MIFFFEFFGPQGKVLMIGIPLTWGCLTSSLSLFSLHIHTSQHPSASSLSIWWLIKEPETILMWLQVSTSTQWIYRSYLLATDDEFTLMDLYQRGTQCFWAKKKNCSRSLISKKQNSFFFSISCILLYTTSILILRFSSSGNFW
jgi:hypothetical protein